MGRRSDTRHRLLCNGEVRTSSEEVEALLLGISQRDVDLVECQPKPRHRRHDPRQRLGRVSATENDEVIGIGDNTCAESFRRAWSTAST
jgi:hypothetical protein